MSDKYELLRESLHELQREASARGGNNPRSQMILDLLADHEALQAECDRLNSYYKNGIDCFANPCEMHSGERTPPFSEFFERYGGRCLICVVDNNKALQAENERLRTCLAETAGVAVTMLYESHKADTLKEFDVTELARMVDYTKHLADANVQVEKVYRKAWSMAQGCAGADWGGVK